MKIFWAVAVGAALGGLARHYLSVAVQNRMGTGFPVGTLIINVTGSFLIGVFMRYAIQSGTSEEVRLLLTSGFCGGYTTFSTFSYETVTLLENGKYARAGLYVGASVLLALAATALGFTLAQRLLVLRARA